MCSYIKSVLRSRFSTFMPFHIKANQISGCMHVTYVTNRVLSLSNLYFFKLFGVFALCVAFVLYCIICVYYALVLCSLNTELGSILVHISKWVSSTCISLGLLPYPLPSLLPFIKLLSDTVPISWGEHLKDQLLESAHHPHF